MRRQGMPFAYSSTLLPAEMIVRRRPKSSDVMTAVKEVLRPHGLTIEDVDGLYVVSHDDSAKPRVARRTRTKPDPETPALSEVIVSASRYELLRDAAAAPQAIDQRAITQLPDLGDDPLRAVQRLPGAASNGVSARTHLRGGSERDTGIVLDGHRLLDPFHVRDYQNLFSAIDVRTIDGIEVYTGGFPIRFGDITDGLVLIDTLSPEEPQRTELGLSVFNTSLLSVGQVANNEAQWVFSARRGNLDKILDEKFGNPTYYDIFGKISVNFSPTTTIAANAFIANDQVNIVTAADPDEREESNNETRNTQFWVSWDQRWTPALSSQTQFSFSDFDSERVASVNDPEKIIGQLSDRRTASIASLLQDWSYELNDAHHLTWGVEFQQENADYDYSSATDYFGLFLNLPGNENSRSSTNQRQVDSNSFAFYLSNRWQPGDKTVVDIGLRWDKQKFGDTASDSQLSPRFSILYAISPKANIRAGWGRYYQSQGIHELQVEDGVTEFFPAQRSDQWIAGLQYQLGERYSLRAEAYSKTSKRLRPRYENLFDVFTIIPELEPDRVAITASEANSRGLELSLNYDNDEGFNWWLTYALARAEDSIDGTDVARTWDQKHALQLGLAWSGQRWSLSAATKLHSGWPKTDVSLNSSSDPTAPVVVFDERNASRYGDFVTLDLRADYKWPLPVGTLSWFLEISNVTNRNNPCCVDFDLGEDGNGSVILDKETEYWLPIIPATGLLWEF